MTSSFPVRHISFSVRQKVNHFFPPKLGSNEKENVKVIQVESIREQPDNVLNN